MKRIVLFFSLLVIIFFVIAFKINHPLSAAIHFIRGKKTISQRIKPFEKRIREQLKKDFERVHISYPPNRVVFVGIKKSKQLEVWVSEKEAPLTFLKSYPILGASGRLGPKLKEGDQQVPEGLYQIESLNPNSLYHLALRINYPNKFDQIKGREDGRTNLGSDIMIHGKSCSVGCLAMGDKTIEELFVLAVDTGIDHISVILTPVDFRIDTHPVKIKNAPKWTPELYRLIEEMLKKQTPKKKANAF